MTEITVSTCRRVNERQLSRIDPCSWPELKRLLRVDNPPEVAEKLRLGLWSSTYFQGDERSSKNAGPHTCVVLDFDAGEPDWKAWESVSYIAHPTHSWTAGTPKWRLIVRVSEPVPAARISSVVTALISAVGEDPKKIDVAASGDAARIWYAPGLAPDRDYPNARENEGPALDWQRLHLEANDPSGVVNWQALTQFLEGILPTYPAGAQPNRNQVGLALGNIARDAGVTEDEASHALASLIPDYARQVGSWVADCYRRSDGPKLGRHTLAWALHSVGADMQAFDSCWSTPNQEPESGLAARLRAMNERFAWDCSTSRVLELTTDSELRRIGVDGFHTRFLPDKVRLGEDRPIGISKVWLNWKGRRTVDQVGVWAPPETPPADALNLWTGWAVTPKPGEWGLIRDHMREVICNGDEPAFTYLFRWCAWTLQNPGAQAQVVVALRGTEGSGKGMFFAPLRQAFGRHAKHIVNTSVLTGRFNAWIENTLFVFVDEALFSGDRQAADVFKGLVTEDNLTLEAKGIDSRTVRNRLSIGLSTNHEWAVPAGPEARRFFVLEVADVHRGDHDYFARLQAQIAGSGTVAFLDAMLRFDLGTWHPRQLVKTAALDEQKTRSLKGAAALVLRMLEDGELPGKWAIDGRVATNALVAELQRSERHYSEMNARADLTAELKKLGASPKKVGHRSDRGWQLPPLPEARQRWSVLHWARPWDERNHWEERGGE